MLAPVTRRLTSPYLVLPAVIAAVFVVVVQLLAMQRAEIIEELSHRIAHSDTLEAARAVRQLAAMPEPPAEILVKAAVSGDRTVADEAREAIHRSLRRAERQLARRRRVKAAGRQLAQLAESLMSHRQEFRGEERIWLARTTAHILELANQIPPRHTPLLATHCDTILTSFEVLKPAQVKLAQHATSGDEQSASQQEVQLDRSDVVRLDPPRELNPAVEARPAVHAAADVSPVNEVVDEPSESVLQIPAAAAWRPIWASPVFRTLAPRATGAAPSDHPSVETAPKELPAEPRTTEEPLAGFDTHTLLKRWLSAEGGHVYALEHELFRRGFGPVNRPLVRQLFSHRVEDRLQLVDAVLAEPGIHAGAWLQLLADDRDAEVRLSAITIMATSNDVALVEKAWQACIHDRDPRIAALAERLRDRRTATQQR